MPISINGTSGISGVDGSSSTPALQGSDSNTGISFGTDEVNINTGGTTRATVDSSGRLLVGTPSTSATSTVLLQGTSGAPIGPSSLWLTRGSTPANENSLGDVIFSDNGHGVAAFLGAYRDGGTWTSGSSQPTRLSFSTTADGASNPTERMRISNNGNVSIGTNASTDVRLDVVAGSQVSCRLSNTSTDDLLAVKGNAGGTSSNAQYVLPMRFGDDTLRGSIYWNGSSVAYNTTSDYRLKDEIAPYAEASSKLSQLQPVTYVFKDNPNTRLEGFIAHEVQSVVPDAVSGTKDEVDADGNPVYQGIDQSKLVPLLTAALQEALAKIETLETRLTALEGGTNP